MNKKFEILREHLGVPSKSYCGPIFQKLIEVTYLVRKICRAIVDISINFWYLLGKLCRITITKEKPLSVLASIKESPILFTEKCMKQVKNSIFKCKMNANEPLFI